MTFQDIRAYSTGLLKASFQNKTTLNKLSTSEDGNLLFDGKEIKSDKGGAGVLIYDTEEQIVGCWIDNKPVYQIVTSKEIENIDTLIYEKILNSDEANEVEKIKILQYTKTTDEPGSFDPRKLPNTVLYMNTDFSNIYYEDKEKIVGCWINGKPIYQRVTTEEISPDIIDMLIYKYIYNEETKLKLMRYTKITDAENSFDYSLITNEETITDDIINNAAKEDKI